jgi:hypothetical protein
VLVQQQADSIVEPAGAPFENLFREPGEKQKRGSRCQQAEK